MNHKITHEYNVVYGFNSKPTEVEGLIKHLKVSLAMNPNISLLLDVVFIDIPNVWGMLLSRKWAATMGGQLQMVLAYVTILQSDVTPFTLYREPMYPTCMVKPRSIPYYKVPETKEATLILPS